MTDNPNTSLFADRYRFELVGNDWDRGRSGFTGLVYDLKEKRLGVIKRTETYPTKSTHSLQNEIKALRVLKGLGVPEVYDTGQAFYDSKKYDYAVLEFIEGFRVEKYLYSLSIVERAEIITQLFGLLSQAHKKGIVNGDVDLKHLFWRQEKKQLIVIDWGNAKLNVDPKRKTEFAYDLARAAEIIFSLVTRQGHPLATGSIALPEASSLVKGFEVLPVEFHNLCKWAPRTPSDGVQAPYTAGELFEASKRWFEAIRDSRPYKQSSSAQKKPGFLGVLFLGIISFMLLTVFVVRNILSPVTSTTPTPTPTNLIGVSAQPLDTNTLTPTPILTVASTEPPLAPIETPLPPLHSPLEYSPLIVFDTRVLGLIFSTTALETEATLCWANAVYPSTELAKSEGFNRKIDETWWIFNTGDDRKNDEAITADFGTCSKSAPIDKIPSITPTPSVTIPLNKSVKALALNTWVTQLKPGSVDAPEGEFGLFLKSASGSVREYTLWVDISDNLHLRIRENGEVTYDDKVVIANIQYGGRGNMYRQFRIQIFLEMDNNGSSVIYLLEAPSNFVDAKSIDPNNMIHVDAATRPAIKDIEGFGLIGRGGSTQVLIWPLVLLGEENP
jgi:serine/threonine protein kinase